MTTPSARRRRNPARQESPSPERVRDTPMLDDPFVQQDRNVSQQLAQMQNDTEASVATVSNLRAQLAALSVPHRATTRGRPGRGTNGRGSNRGRGRPRQTEERALPNYKICTGRPKSWSKPQESTTLNLGSVARAARCLYPAMITHQNSFKDF
jgi:hypothetical protein